MVNKVTSKLGYKENPHFKEEIKSIIASEQKMVSKLKNLESQLNVDNKRLKSHEQTVKKLIESGDFKSLPVHQSQSIHGGQITILNSIKNNTQTLIFNGKILDDADYFTVSDLETINAEKLLYISVNKTGDETLKLNGKPLIKHSGGILRKGVYVDKNSEPGWYAFLSQSKTNSRTASFLIDGVEFNLPKGSNLNRFSIHSIYGPDNFAIRFRSDDGKTHGIYSPKKGFFNLPEKSDLGDDYNVILGNNGEFLVQFRHSNTSTMNIRSRNGTKVRLPSYTKVFSPLGGKSIKLDFFGEAFTLANTPAQFTLEELDYFFGNGKVLEKYGRLETPNFSAKDNKFTVENRVKTFFLLNGIILQELAPGKYVASNGFSGKWKDLTIDSQFITIDNKKYLKNLLKDISNLIQD